MNYLPIFLDITQKRVLLIGGGKVALHKIQGLQQFAKDLTVLATEIRDEIRCAEVHCILSAYTPASLDGFDLVYACTSDRELNRRIRDDARQRHLLVNVVDDPELSDFISPAVHCSGPMTVAVSSGGKDVKRTVALRNEIRNWMHDKT